MECNDFQYMSYPKYRKLANLKAFYKLINEHEFEELKIMGKKYCLNHYVALQLPERIYIQDIMTSSIEISEVDYNGAVEECTRSLLKVML